MRDQIANPVLVETVRGGTAESFHRGAFCIVDSGGKVIHSMGDIHRMVFPRSALKLFQVIPLLEHSGIERFGFTDDEIAVMCASHNGEPRHLAAVKSILEKIGLSEAALGCGAHYPFEDESMRQLYIQGVKPSALHNNCSGKHAGFLALCRLKGWPIENYLDPSHPAQALIRETIADIVDYPASRFIIGVDGCSAPIYAFPLYNLALGAARLMSKALNPARKQAAQAMIGAVAGFPWFIAGTNRYCTSLVEHCGEEIIGKTGAEAVYTLALYRRGIGVAIKVDDGKSHIQYAIAQRIVSSSGLFDEEKLRPLEAYMQIPVFNWNRIQTCITQTVFDVPQDFALKTYHNAEPSKQ